MNNGLIVSAFTAKVFNTIHLNACHHPLGTPLEELPLHLLSFRQFNSSGVNEKPKIFKTAWHDLQEILKLSGMVNQASLKLYDEESSSESINL